MTQEEELQWQEEYSTRKLIWHFTWPSWVRFNNLPSCITRYPRYWWMTQEQMEWFCEMMTKGHPDAEYFSKPYVKYSDPVEVEKCKSGVDRNIRRIPMTEGAKRHEAYRYLKSSFR